MLDLLEIVLTHVSITIVPVHTFYALIRGLLTWIVVFGHRLAVARNSCQHVSHALFGNQM